MTVKELIEKLDLKVLLRTTTTVRSQTAISATCSHGSWGARPRTARG